MYLCLFALTVLTGRIAASPLAIGAPAIPPVDNQPQPFIFQSRQNASAEVAREPTTPETSSAVLTTLPAFVQPFEQPETSPAGPTGPTTTNLAIPLFPLDQTIKPPPQPSGCGTDVLIIIKDSGTVNEGFELEKDLAAQVVFLANPDATPNRVGVLHYNYAAFVLFSLGKQIPKDIMIDRIKNLTLAGGSTNTFDALRTANEEFTTNGRPNVNKMVVLITDGNSENTLDNIEYATRALVEQHGAVVYSASSSTGPGLYEFRAYSLRHPERVFLKGNLTSLIPEVERNLAKFNCRNSPFQAEAVVRLPATEVFNTPDLIQLPEIPPAASLTTAKKVQPTFKTESTSTAAPTTTTKKPEQTQAATTSTSAKPQSSTPVAPPTSPKDVKQAEHASPSAPPKASTINWASTAVVKKDLNATALPALKQSESFFVPSNKSNIAPPAFQSAFPPARILKQEDPKPAVAQLNSTSSAPIATTAKASGNASTIVPAAITTKAAPLPTTSLASSASTAALAHSSTPPAIAASSSKAPTEAPKASASTLLVLHDVEQTPSFLENKLERVSQAPLTPTSKDWVVSKAYNVSNNTHLVIDSDLALSTPPPPALNATSKA